MPIRFEGSPSHTLGVELEVGIVADDTGELSCAAPRILTELAGRPAERFTIKQEMFESTLEVTTGVCRTPAEAAADLRAGLDLLGPLLRVQGLSLLGAGIHPFSAWGDQRVTAEGRYLRMAERLGWPVRRMTTYGVHVHVGVPTGDHAIAAADALTGLLPHLLALSASSPFRGGRDSGQASVRTLLWQAVPRSGLPPRLEGWVDYVRVVTALRRAGTIDSPRDLWWDVRPSPSLGTVEMRICDSVPSIGHICALAALVQAAVAHACARLDAGEPIPRPPDWLVQENKWRAARDGTAAILMTADGSTRSILDEVGEWVDAVGPLSRDLGTRAQLEELLGIAARRSLADKLRDIVAGGGSLLDVVSAVRVEGSEGAIGPQGSTLDIHGPGSIPLARSPGPATGRRTGDAARRRA